MKTLKLTQGSGSRSISSYAGMFTVLAILLSLGFSSSAYAYTQLTRQLDFGQTNADVTSLQQFLAASPNIYPQGLVTGYFGSLTRAAVIRFQAQYGLAQVGRVGPLTLAKINSLIASGTVNIEPGTSPAVFLQTIPQITANTATFKWMTTNEAAYGRLYYSTAPLQMNEGDIYSNGFAVTSGQLAGYDGVARTSQMAVVTGLQPNTKYYYTIVATDVSGNASVVGPNNSFITPAF